MRVVTFAAATSTLATGIADTRASGAEWRAKNIWAAASWDSMSNWSASRHRDQDYDYGNTVTYQDNSVYMDGQDIGTADEYYRQAQTYRRHRWRSADD